MKLFTCTQCHQVVFFESVTCVHCGQRLAYLPDSNAIAALEPVYGGQGTASLYHAIGTANRYRLCENATQHSVCNWAVAERDDNRLCVACRLNRIIPDLRFEDAKEAWSRLEVAKHRLVYGLRELGLPIASRYQNEPDLAFVFAADQAGQRVLTGHEQGVITINIAEADAPFRERIRERLGEPFRTLLGHFRHESGHYYWDRLIKRNGYWLARFRATFGDERADYAQALKQHYEQGGPPADWRQWFISAYASSHPLEDWAESFAHYLHMVDTLDTAASYGMTLRPSALGGGQLDHTAARKVDFGSFEELVEAWVPLTLALNSLNRGMGLQDVYPFVLSEPATRKLRFVHELVRSASERPR